MPTRIQVQTAISSRLDAFLRLVHGEMREASYMTPIPVDPATANPLYNDAIGWAGSLVGAVPEDPSLVTDADVARVPAASYYTFLDLATYRQLESALNAFIMPDSSGQDRSESWNGMRGIYAARLKEMAATLKPFLRTDKYTLGSGAVGLPISTPGWSGEYCVPDTFRGCD